MLPSVMAPSTLRITLSISNSSSGRKLEDYSIHSISSGEDALGEVVIKLRSGKHLITGHGLSVDIMEASILAYINGINKLVEMGDRYR